MCTVYLGDDVGGFLCSGIVVTWLSMRLWPFSFRALVLYICNSGRLHVLPQCGCSSGGLTSVSSGITWVSVWGGFLFARPGFIVIFAFLFTL